MLLFLAAQPLHIGLLSALLAGGFVLGVFGHMHKSRNVVLIGILIVGVISTYFAVFTLVPH